MNIEALVVFTVDTDEEMDEYYIDRTFTLGDEGYIVWSWYGSDEFGNNTYQCRRHDGTGAIFLTTDSIDTYLPPVRCDKRPATCDTNPATDPDCYYHG